MTETNSAPRHGALRWVLGATAIAGATGYLIQLVAPAFVKDYLSFSVFWSVMYFIGAALSGLQQEATRASHRRAEYTSEYGWSTLRTYGAVGAAAMVVLVLASAPLWASRVFTNSAPALVAALCVGIIGYALTATISGALYGISAWRGVAAMTVTDSVVRMLTVGIAVLAGAGTAILGWAIAVPFLVAVSVVWAIFGARVRDELALDAPLHTLYRNGARTVVASAAMGAMISGLPFLLSGARHEGGVAELETLILVITLTRAPLVIPLLALQSYLVLSFRGMSPGRRLLLWCAAFLGLTAALAALASWLAPLILNLLYADRYVQLPPLAYAAIVASAGLTGLMCITGPAVLAGARHTWYVAGWVIAAVTLIALLWMPVEQLPRDLWAIVLAPVAGALVHGISLALPNKAVPSTNG